MTQKPCYSVKKIHVCNATMSKENLVAYFMPVRMV